MPYFKILSPPLTNNPLYDSLLNFMSIKLQFYDVKAIFLFAQLTILTDLLKLRTLLWLHPTDLNHCYHKLP